MLAGPNLEAIEELAQAAKLPVIASGGVSRLSDVQALLELEPKGVVGIIIGKALYAGALNFSEVRSVARKAV
jgi:phosphoribosylformimino-5-aminoimidazole carboxamide ribotide isomerase